VSNWQKAELVNDNFGIRSFRGCHDKISPRDQFMLKGQVCPEISDSAIRPSFDRRNPEVADYLESDNEPSESGESYLTEWYSEIRKFQFSLAFRI
jgi:hypothetical protein